jgi:DNA (cytosine-5)-methyltransferase 1
MILVDDDVRVSPDFQRSRSPSIISTASSQTLRAESAEPEIVLSTERLSVEPSNANNGKRRCPSECDDQSATSQRRPRLSAHAREGRVLINIEEEEDLRAREYDEKSDQIIDLEEIEQTLGEEMFGLCEASRVQKSAGLAAGPRNGPVLVPFAEVGSYKWNGLSLRAGKTIELITGAFLKIKAVIQNLATDEVTIRGWKLMRARCLAGCLPKKINELAFIFEVDLDDPRSYLEQSVVEVGLNDVLRIRKLICTNHAFPKFRFNEDYVEGNSEKEMMNYIEHHEVLVARWKLTTKFGDVYNRIQNTKKPACSLFNQSQIESLLDEECTPGHAIAASIRRFAWRGRTILGGSGTKVKMKPEGRPDPSRKCAKVQDFISLLDDRYDEGSNKEKAKGHRNIQQGYTFCDTCEGPVSYSHRILFLKAYNLQY